MRLTPGNVAAVNDLYTRIDDTGELTDEIERFLDESLERPFAGIRNRLIYGPAFGLNGELAALTSDERVAISRFLSFQQLRTPSEREATRWLGYVSTHLFSRDSTAAGSELREHVERAVRRGLNPAEAEILRKAVLDLPQLHAGIDDWLPRTTRNAERLAHVINAFEWQLIRLPDTYSLPTCDTPLVCVRDVDGTGDYELGGGWNEPGFEATFTLSPRDLLYITKAVRDEGYLRSPTFADSVFKRTIAHATEWVYSAVPDPRIDAIAFHRSQA